MSARSAASDFLSPLPLVAVAAMALNDALLKPTFHNALTGKLSDVAICFFLPLYLSALLGLALRLGVLPRLLLGAALTAVLFTALKLSPHAAHSFADALTWVGRPVGFHAAPSVTDPTDLFALVFVVLAVAWGLRQASAVPPTLNPEVTSP